MSDAERDHFAEQQREIGRLRGVLGACLDYVGADADRYGTASTAGPLLDAILRALGRGETADQYVLSRRAKRKAEAAGGAGGG